MSHAPSALQRNRDRRGEAGFTVSEAVLVLVVFIGLVVVITVSVGGLRSDADQRDCRSELRAIRSASVRYQADVGTFPPNKAELLQVSYLAEEDAPNYEVSPVGGNGDPTYPATGPCA